MKKTELSTILKPQDSYSSLYLYFWCSRLNCRVTRGRSGLLNLEPLVRWARIREHEQRAQERARNTVERRKDGDEEVGVL